MNITPQFLDEFQLEQVSPEPAEVEGRSPLRVQSFWGFDSPPNSQKDWLVDNTLQVFEPVEGGQVRIWEVTTTFAIPYNAERGEYQGRAVPAFAVADLDGAMAELGYGVGEWNLGGGPMLTYTLTNDAAPDILKRVREVVLSKPVVH